MRSRTWTWTSMAEDTENLFGKVDAILGKRAGFVASRREEQDDEFPMLTDVVEEGTQLVATLASVDALSSPAPVPSGRIEAVEQAEAPEDMPAAESLNAVDADRLAVALETRLSELFDRQQRLIESMVRRIVREELDARKD